MKIPSEELLHFSISFLQKNPIGKTRTEIQREIDPILKELYPESNGVNRQSLNNALDPLIRDDQIIEMEPEKIRGGRRKRKIKLRSLEDPPSEVSISFRKTLDRKFNISNDNMDSFLYRLTKIRNATEKTREKFENNLSDPEVFQKFMDMRNSSREFEEIAETDFHGKTLQVLAERYRAKLHGKMKKVWKELEKDPEFHALIKHKMDGKRKGLAHLRRQSW